MELVAIGVISIFLVILFAYIHYVERNILINIASLKKDLEDIKRQNESLAFDTRAQHYLIAERLGLDDSDQ